MKIISSEFKHNTLIPKKYTCNGMDINPPFEFLDVPYEAKSLVFMMEDPDVPKFLREDGMWIHWVLWNIDPKLRLIEEGVAPKAVYGITTKRTLGYGGPCPPDGQHRYFFKLYALDIELDLKEGSTKEELEKVMNSHIIDQSEFIGLYEQIK